MLTYVSVQSIFKVYEILCMEFSTGIDPLNTTKRKTSRIQARNKTRSSQVCRQILSLPFDDWSSQIYSMSTIPFTMRSLPVPNSKIKAPDLRDTRRRIKVKVHKSRYGKNLVYGAK